MRRQRRESTRGLGGLVLPALVFCLVGLVATVLAAREFEAAQRDWQAIAMLSLCALVFGGIGSALTALVVSSGRILQRERERREGATAAARDADPEPPRLAGEGHERGERSRIRFSERAGGGGEIIFPAARNPGPAAGVTLFCLLVTGCSWLTARIEAPSPFAIVTGLFAFVLFLGALELWLGVVRVEFDRAGVKVRSGLLGVGRTRGVPAGEVATVTTRVGMTAGKTAYYDIEIVTTGCQRVYAGRHVRSKREAERIAEALRAALVEETREPEAGTDSSRNLAPEDDRTTAGSR